MILDGMAGILDGKLGTRMGRMVGLSFHRNDVFGRDGRNLDGAMGARMGGRWFELERTL